MIPPDSVNDNDGNSEELLIKKNGDLVSRPTEGKILFVSYYFYDEEVYKVPLINNEPVTVIGERFNGESYFSQFFQGNQNLDADPIDVGEHNGDISWKFMIHNKTISMEDIRGIDCESDDMSELVDNIYAFYEGYLPSNKEVQIKSENRVVVEVSFRGIDDEIYDWYEYEKKVPVTEDGRKDFFILKLHNFIASLKERFGGSIGEKILLSDNGKDFHELNERLNSINFEYYDDVRIYILFINKTSGDDLNMLFLSSMDDYYIGAKFPKDNELIVQGYDNGEYDTGYFAPSAIVSDEGYICGHIEDDGSFKSFGGWEEEIKAYNIAMEMLKK